MRLPSILPYITLVSPSRSVPVLQTALLNMLSFVMFASFVDDLLSVLSVICANRDELVAGATYHLNKVPKLLFCLWLCLCSSISRNCAYILEVMPHWNVLRPVYLPYLSFYLKPSNHMQSVLHYVWHDKISCCASMYIVHSWSVPRKSSFSWIFILSWPCLVYCLWWVQIISIQCL